MMAFPCSLKTPPSHYCRGDYKRTHKHVQNVHWWCFINLVRNASIVIHKHRLYTLHFLTHMMGFGWLSHFRCGIIFTAVYKLFHMDLRLRNYSHCNEKNNKKKILSHLSLNASCHSPDYQCIRWCKHIYRERKSTPKSRVRTGELQEDLLGLRKNSLNNALRGNMYISQSENMNRCSHKAFSLMWSFSLCCIVKGNVKTYFIRHGKGWKYLILALSNSIHFYFCRANSQKKAYLKAF